MTTAKKGISVAAIPKPALQASKGEGRVGKRKRRQRKEEKGRLLSDDKRRLPLFLTPISMLRCLSTLHLFYIDCFFSLTFIQSYTSTPMGGACDMVSILFFFPQKRNTRVSLENNFFIQFYFLFLLSFYLPKK